MKARAFVPGHITGFFDIVQDENLLKTGSRGCGVVIDKGVYTEVRVKKASMNKIDIYIDGKPCECEVTENVVREVLRKVEGKFHIKIFHSLDVPMRQGFGTSGAGALGAGIALNKALDLGLDLEEIGKIAHTSEVMNNTGLGDVIAECNGGMVIRKEAGAPTIGKVLKISCNDVVVSAIIGKEIETKNILKDNEKRMKIMKVGNDCLRLLLKEPSPKHFLTLSKKFALETGLMNKEVYSAIKALEKKDIEASMIMLGNSIFTLIETPEMVCNALNYRCIISKIDTLGARSLGSELYDEQD